mmetsp:Transcript_9913/g.21012  ORF Transcript_9913/g.21012 Transcript_9913/m.21012 type:complete len:263 (-) Transcript_9913:344-1132(-)
MVRLRLIRLQCVGNLWHQPIAQVWHTLAIVHRSGEVGVVTRALGWVCVLLAHAHASNDGVIEEVGGCSAEEFFRFLRRVVLRTRSWVVSGQVEIRNAGGGEPPGVEGLVGRHALRVNVGSSLANIPTFRPKDGHYAQVKPRPKVRKTVDVHQILVAHAAVLVRVNPREGKVCVFLDIPSNRLVNGVERLDSIMDKDRRGEEDEQQYCNGELHACISFAKLPPEVLLHVGAQHSLLHYALLGAHIIHQQLVDGVLLLRDCINL